MLTYFGRVRFKGHLPGGTVAVGLDDLASRLVGRPDAVGLPPVGARLDEIADELRRDYGLGFRILPMSNDPCPTFVSLSGGGDGGGDGAVRPATLGWSAGGAA